MKKIISLILLYIVSLNQVSAWIFFYSIMPNTTDDKNLEYIELYNSWSWNINLEWYQIKDKSNKIYTFGSGEFLQAEQQLKFYRTQTSILLNNTDEDIFLYDKSWSLIDSFSYSTSTKWQEIIIHNITQSTQTWTTNSGSTDSNSWSTNSWTTSSWALTNSWAINTNNNSWATNTWAINNSGSTNTWSLTNSWTTNQNTNSWATNSWAIINSGSTNTWTIEKINLIYEFQNPSYVTDKTTNMSEYICDNSKDECKINLNLEKSFTWSFKKSNYTCKIDFGLKWWNTWEENKCNPTSITFPKWIYEIKMQIISKSDPGQIVEKQFTLKNNIEAQIIEKEKIIYKDKIVYKDKICSSSSSSSSNSSNSNSSQNTNTTTNHPNINIISPLITIQSWIKAGVCTKTDCNVNLIYEPKNKNEQCLWDFWNWTYNTKDTDKKCNPWYVKFSIWNHKISLKVFDKYNPNNYKISYLNFSNFPKNKTKNIVDNKIDKQVNIIDTKNINTEHKEENQVDIVDKYIDKKEILEDKDLENSLISYLKQNTNSWSIDKNKEKIIKEIKDLQKETKNINSTKISTKSKNKIHLPYFMDDYKIQQKEKEQNIIIQWRLWSKILSWSTVTCTESCSINLIAKDNNQTTKYIWDFWNWIKFTWQNPSYVKYNKSWTYNIKLTSYLKNNEIKTDLFKVIVKEKPKIIKKKKKKTYKKRKSYKSKTTENKWIFLTKEKLENNYIPIKILKSDFIEKQNVWQYCSSIDYFPETINRFKILVIFLISMLIILMWFMIAKQREII